MRQIKRDFWYADSPLDRTDRRADYGGLWFILIRNRLQEGVRR